MALLLAAACQGGSVPSPTPSAAGSPGTDGRKRPLPSRWVGASLEKGRIALSVTEVGERPRRDSLEPPAPGRAARSRELTDLAYDTRQERIYVGTCCEPGAGQLRRVDWQKAPAFLSEDRGFAVDVAGASSIVARTDTFGTLRVQPALRAEEEIRPDAGVADVAVNGQAAAWVVALVDSRRLQALVPGVAAREPALLVEVLTTTSGWVEETHPLPRERTYCRVVPLPDASVGLLMGAFDPQKPLECTGDRLDVYDTGRRRLRDGALTFPGRVRHLSIDDSSTYLIFTTVDGAVGWRTPDGRGGELAASGFLAADW